MLEVSHTPPLMERLVEGIAARRLPPLIVVVPLQLLVPLKMIWPVPVFTRLIVPVVFWIVPA